MRLFLISSLPIVFSLAPTLAGQPTPPAIRVVNAEKGWVAGSKPVGRGDRLPANAELTTLDSGDLTLDCGAPGWISYSCRSGRCRVQACSLNAPGLDIHRVDVRAVGFLQVPVDLLTALFTREPRTTVMAVTRSTGNPSDAVLLQSAQGIHFGPSLARMVEGHYCLHLSQLPRNPSQPARVFVLDWDRTADAEGVIRGSTLPAGTYLLEKGTLPANSKNSGCVTDSEALPSWVVIAPESRFARASQDWNSKQNAFAELERSGASAALLDTLRHALLASISDSVEAR
jgi:hypothetical protein